MSDVFKTLLLLALPASGKSEVRRYLAQLEPETCRRDFHIGPTVQIDDFPYVHAMRLIDEHLRTKGGDLAFFQAPDGSFRSPRDWGTLTELLNDDYTALVSGRIEQPASAAVQLFDRIDAAAERVGLPKRLAALAPRVRAALVDRLEAEAAELLHERNQLARASLSGRTLVVEFARGGPAGTGFPLPEGFGYAWSLAQLSSALLADAAILYVWVTPEESRRKNRERANPADPGSILHHGVPEAVMQQDYATDDMQWLLDCAPRPGTIAIEARGRSFSLPVARFDNRVDCTSFLRAEPKAWPEAEVRALHDALKQPLDAAFAALRH